MADPDEGAAGPIGIEPTHHGLLGTTAGLGVEGGELVEAGERSLRSLMRTLAIEPVPEAEWRGDAVD